MNSVPCPHWLARLMGLDIPPGEGVSAGVRFDWPLSIGWTVAVVALLAALVCWNYAREDARLKRRSKTGFGWLRFVAIALLLFMAARPAIHLTRTGLPTLLILFDDSRSMTLADPYDEAELSELQRRFPRVFEELEEANGPDASEADRADAPTRWRIAQALFAQDEAERLRRLAQRYRLEAHFLSGSESLSDPSPDVLARAVAEHKAQGEESPLGDRIRQLLRGRSGAAPAAILLISDGVTTVGPSPVAVASEEHGTGVPLYGIGVGQEASPLDVTLHDLVADEYAFLGDPVTLKFRLSSKGAAGRRVRLTLRDANDRRVLTEQAVAIDDDDESRSVSLSLRLEREGRHDLLIEAEPLDGERQTANNRLRHTLDVRRDQLRVLLVQSYPSYEYRFLRDLLSREPTIRLDSILQEADPEYVEQAEGQRRLFPTTREELFAYDCVILGDADPSRWSPAQHENLADFLQSPESGGVLICLAGKRYMPTAYADAPLGALLPFSPYETVAPPPDASLDQPFLVRPTELGLLMPGMQLAASADDAGQQERIWSELPPIYWAVELRRLKAGATVLATRADNAGSGSGDPLIILQHVGAGDLLFHAMPTWRWHYREYREAYARYWLQTIHTMCRSKFASEQGGVSLRTDRKEYREGEPVVARLQFFAQATPGMDAPLLRLRLADGSEQAVRVTSTPGLAHAYQATIEGLAPGEHVLSLATPTVAADKSPTARFTVAPRGDEFARLEADLEELRLAAARSNGLFGPAVDADRLLKRLPRGNRTPVEALPPRPLWNWWLLLLIALALFCTEWALRRRAGMP